MSVSTTNSSSNLSSIPIYDPNASANSATSSSTGTSVQDMTQNFLKMLTVQLQNQDPLNPMDNASMTTQLAALNQVDGINRLNTSINSLVSQVQSANFMNLSSSVGKTAMAQGSDVFFSGNSVYTSTNLSNAASDVKAIIKDSTGQVIKTVDLGAANAGNVDFIWDGTNDAGSTVSTGHYQIQFSAVDATGAASTPASYVGSSVASVGQDSTGILLGLADGRQVKSTDILKWVGF
jgi:flagellar basal-body rod modification protein FlgD